MDIEKEIERFIRQQVYADREEGKPLHKFILRHSLPGSKGNDVESFDIKEDFTNDDAKPLALEIFSRAQADADGMGGVQRYVLHATLKGETKSCGRCAFRLRGGDDEVDEPIGEEAANPKGLLTQLMRHNEANNRIMMQSVGAMMTMLGRRLESADTQVQKLIQQRSDDMELMERLRSDQHLRDMDLLKLEAGEKRKDALFEQAKLLGPAILNKVAGKQLLPGDSPFVIAVKSLGESITPDQFEGLQKVLNTEQLIVLINLLQSLNDKEKKPATS